MSSIESFRQFLVLAEHLNFSTAAESLFITQSALSRHISALEASVGAKLFERDTHSVSLTSAGVLFNKGISEIVDKYQDLCTQLRVLNAGYEKQLRISCPYYAIHDYLGSIPELFEKKYVDSKLLYTFGDPNEAMGHLMSDRADLAIIPYYPGPSVGALCRREVFVEQLGVLMNQKNPLAAKSVLSVADLKGKLFFSVGNNYFQASWHHIANICKDAGFTAPPPELFRQMEDLIIAIGNGSNAVSVVGRHMRTQESERIAFRPLSDESCVRKVCIWYKKGNSNPSIKQFIDIYVSQEFKRNI